MRTLGIRPLSFELTFGTPWEWKPLSLPAYTPSVLILRWLCFGFRIKH
jgi:hypothetical protein